MKKIEKTDTDDWITAWSLHSVCWEIVPAGLRSTVLFGHMRDGKEGYRKL